jgi:hypothetical protein
MIHVFFVPGMFGSTIEYVLRNYTKEYEKIVGEVLEDGSMHSFEKEFHPGKAQHLVDRNICLNPNSITTSIYPYQDLHLNEILQKFPLELTDHCIIIHGQDLRSAELNCLFQYHKIAYGKIYRTGLGIFVSSSNTHHVSSWNSNYKSWHDMQIWELREWFSIFYPSWVSEWIDSPSLVTANWLTVSNLDILNYPYQEFKKIIDFCNLTQDTGLNEFAAMWRAKQQYIIDEFELLDQIVSSVLSQHGISWDKLNIIAESIIQQRLRSKGYEIMCDGLNTFPTSSEDLYKLLIKV